MYAASHNATVGNTWVAEVVRAHRYEIAGLRRRFKRNVPHPQRRNTIWGLDYTGKGDAAGVSRIAAIPR
jgi:putative transposase